MHLDSRAAEPGCRSDVRSISEASPQIILNLRWAKDFEKFERLLSYNTERVMDSRWDEVTLSRSNLLLLITDLHDGAPGEDVPYLFLSMIMTGHLPRHELNHAKLGRVAGDCFHEHARSLLSVIMLCQ